MFVSLETNDGNGAIIESLAGAIDQNIMIVTSAELLSQFFYFASTGNIKNVPALMLTPEFIKFKHAVPDIQKKLADDANWLKYINSEKNLAVLMPAHYHKTIQQLVFSRGLTNINYQALYDLLEKNNKISEATPEHFIHLFNMNEGVQAQFPKRIWIVGHGSEKVVQLLGLESIIALNTKPLICGEKIKDLACILSNLKKLNTEFLYLVSCKSSGENLIKLRNQVLASDVGIECFLKQVNYPIVFQASCDAAALIIEPDGNYFNKFFDALNLAFLNKKYFKNYIQCLANAMNIPFEARSAACNVPSLCMPGGHFRSINCSNVYNINFCILGNHRETNKEIVIPQNVQFVTVQPSNLSNTIMSIVGSRVPIFVSKIPGDAQHIIGTIKTPNMAMDEIINDLFFSDFFDGKVPAIVKPTSLGGAKKAWFLGSLIAKDQTYNGVAIYRDFHHDDLIIYKQNDQYYLCRQEEGQKAKTSVISSAQYHLFLAAMHHTTMPQEDALKESALGFESPAEVSNAFKNFLHQCNISEADLVNDNTVQFVQELFKSIAQTNLREFNNIFLADEYLNWLITVRSQPEILAIAQKWLLEISRNAKPSSVDLKKAQAAASILKTLAERGNPDPLIESIAQMVPILGGSVCDTLIDLGLNDAVLQLVKNMMVSQEWEIRFKALDLYCKLLRAAVPMSDDKRLRTLALEIVKELIINSNNIEGCTRLQEVFNNFLRLGFGKELVQIMHELLSSNDSNELMAGLWLSRELFRNGKISAQDLNDQKIVGAICFMVNSDKLQRDQKFIIDGFTYLFIENGNFESARKIAYQMLNVFKNDNVQDILRKETEDAHKIDIESLFNTSVNLEEMFNQGMIIIQKLIEQGQQPGTELVATIDGYLSSNINDIVISAIRAAAKLLESGIYSLDKLPLLKEKALEMHSIGAMRSLVDALLKLKKFDQVYHIFNLSQLGPISTTELFIKLIENNYFPMVASIDGLISSLMSRVSIRVSKFVHSSA